MQPSIRIPLISSILPSMAHVYLGQRQAAATITTAPPAAVILQQNQQCMVLSSALSICTSLTPGFTNMAPTKQAECLCYSSTLYLPAPFDNAVKTCADFASTAAPAAYGAIASLQDFCLNAGNCCGIPLTRSTAMSTSTAAFDQCNAVQSYLSSCTSAIPGFTALQPIEQASCLCFASSTWAPAGFDMAVKTCAGAASTMNLSIYSEITLMNGFCGNMSVPTPQPTSVPPTTESEDTSAETATANALPLPPSPAPMPTSVPAKATSTYTMFPPGSTTTLPLPTNRGGTTSGQTGLRPKRIKDSEVVLVSLVCAAVILFLC